jgi:hypothetical protein
VEKKARSGGIEVNEYVVEGGEGGEDVVCVICRRVAGLAGAGCARGFGLP